MPKIRKQFRWKIVIRSVLALTIILILSGKQHLFGQKQGDMVKFYFLDNATFEANRDKFGLGTANLITWYKSTAKVYSFSAIFNKTIIADNRMIGYIIGAKALENNLLGSTDTTGFAYFYLSDYFARSISKELATLDLKGLEKTETDSFQKMLNETQDKTGSCMVEFAKKEAWFDYDDTLKKKKAMEQQTKEELKKKGLIVN